MAITHPSNFLSNSDFEYHLNSAEKELVLQAMPRVHRGQRTACFFMVKLDQSPPQKLIVIRLNYIIRLIKVINKEKSKHILDIHILKIHTIRTLDDNTTEILYSDHRAIFWCQICDRFTRKLLRDYLYVASITKKPAQLLFCTHNDEMYPPFTPKLSFSQSIQFLYDAFCTYYKVDYHQEFVQFFHYLILSQNVIFDMCLLNPHLVDSDFLRGKRDLTPLFAVLRYIPYFIGITATKINISNGLSLVASVIRYSSAIRLISLPKCGLTTGAKRLATTFRINKRINLIYLDLSGNPKINDMELLMSSLESLKYPLYHLDLSHCNMSVEATSNLINSIVNNQNLHSLKYLDITGSKMTRETVAIFSNYFSEHHETLKTCHLGIILQGYSAFNNILNLTPSTITSLSLNGSRISEKKAKGLVLFVSNIKALQELDLSYTTIKVSTIEQIIDAVSKNNEITWFNLHLNGLNLNKSNLQKVIAAFDESRLRMWYGLSFEDNGMNSDDLQLLINSLRQMINLATIDIGYNFDSTMNKIDILLPKFLQFQRLNKLSIRGGNGHSLGYENLKKFFNSFSFLDQPIRLDIRYNDIGVEGIRDVCKLIRENRFVELQIDGSTPDQPNCLLDLADAINESSSLTMCDFPVKDAKRLIEIIDKDEIKITNTISDAYVQANLKLASNWAECGIHSRWTNINDIPLDDIVDEMTFHFHHDLDKARVREHSFASDTVGLPLPFQDMGDKIRAGGDKIEMKDPLDEYYFSPHHLILEPIQPNIADIHYISLKIRRPGCDQNKEGSYLWKRQSNSSMSFRDHLAALSSEERRLADIFDDEEEEDQQEHHKEEEEEEVEEEEKRREEDKNNETSEEKIAEGKAGEKFELLLKELLQGKNKKKSNHETSSEIKKEEEKSTNRNSTAQNEEKHKEKFHGKHETKADEKLK
ncbi:hypothetical protein TRFO_05268 [Tritrichomonas foetus]|uniref:Leucine Rich Repeat family protein n=1 Tax=Tritrichomonas foetus TaxID=1144522 RepID=A0A1J4K7U3_9EUKA|nr:hypothetical protein TRFO_05268 [Tritrichomonas foetus]|eukprot:OHT07074.1 hypothetical protein TRFO_05268 [Tritrichomonas foetus]